MAALHGVPRHATRAPEGKRRAHSGPPAARYDTSPVWPGITAGHDARCQCTWAPKNGTYQVKYANRMCPLHGRFR